jgi:O-antigen/teichoic acid export membrane protein
MTLVKTSILSLIATLVKVSSGLVINKAVAMYIGPSGLALIGQFQNFIQIIMTISGGLFNTGVVRYCAKYQHEQNKLVSIMSTAFLLSLISSVVVGIFLIVFNNVLADFILKDASYSFVYILLGFTLILFTLNNFFLSILNGMKKIKTFILITVLQSLYSLVFSTLLIVFFNIEGALIAMATNQSIIFLFTINRMKRYAVFKINNFNQGIDLNSFKSLSKFAAMAITSALVLPISHIYIRNYLGESVSWEAAGHWQAIWLISATYLMLITLTLQTYYLPRLSEISNKKELVKEVVSGYKIIMPIVIFTSFIIYFLREFIVITLFTESFMPIVSLLIWQLIGDIIRVSSLLLSKNVVAKAKYKIHIFSEIIFSLSFVILSIHLIDAYGVSGILFAYIINYTIYFFYMLIAFKRYLNE